MAPINVTNVEVLDNPSSFTNPFQFQITFECVPPGVKEELEWKIVYVGAPEDEKHDQTLDSVLVGPVQLGCNKFVFQADAPNPTLIPDENLLDVTVVLLLGLYKDQEFIRVGYYVNNEIPGYTPDPDNPQPVNARAHLQQIQRIILANQPRVTRHEIAWDDDVSQEQRLLAEHQAAEASAGVDEDMEAEEEEEEESEEDSEEDEEEGDVELAEDNMA